MEEQENRNQETSHQQQYFNQKTCTPAGNPKTALKTPLMESSPSNTPDLSAHTADIMARMKFTPPTAQRILLEHPNERSTEPMILAPPEPAGQLISESIPTCIPADPHLTDEAQPEEIFCGALDGQAHDDISQDKDTSQVECDSQECYDQQELREPEFQIEPLSQSKEWDPNECYDHQEFREVDCQKTESKKGSYGRA